MRVSHAVLAAAIVTLVMATPLAAQTTNDWSAVEAAIGRSGVAQAGDVYRFNFPRSDLKVMVGQVQLKPALALGGWVAFKRVSDGAIATGDLVLLETEVNRVISALQAG